MVGTKVDECTYSGTLNSPPSISIIERQDPSLPPPILVNLVQPCKGGKTSPRGDSDDQGSGGDGGGGGGSGNSKNGSSRARGKGKRSAKGSAGKKLKGNASPPAPVSPGAADETDTASPWLRACPEQDAKEERGQHNHIPAMTAEALFGRGSILEGGEQAALDGEALVLRALVPPT